MALRKKIVQLAHMVGGITGVINKIAVSRFAQDCIAFRANRSAPALLKITGSSAKSAAII